MCSSAISISNENRTTIAFQTAELSIIEYDIFKFSLSPPHLEPEMEMKPVEFFIQFGVSDYWMDGTYFGPNQNILI
jgi:hypothetical protein